MYVTKNVRVCNIHSAMSTVYIKLICKPGVCTVCVRLGFCAALTIFPMRQWALLLNTHSDWLNFSWQDVGKTSMHN